MSSNLKEDILKAVEDSKKETLDRRTALKVLQDLSSKMRPRTDIFDRKILVIDRRDFEEIRARYLDRNDVKDSSPVILRPPTQSCIP